MLPKEKTLNPSIQPIHRCTPNVAAQAAACATAWALSGLTPVLAQSTTTMPPVEITGTMLPSDSSVAESALRGAMPIDKTPQSVVVLPRSLLDEQGTRTLTDGLSNVASVRGTDTRDTLNFGLRIRGFEAGVLLDGVALPGTFTTPELLTGVSRVEVVKGPAGTLWGGSQAAGNGGFVGGLVAVTTASPEAKFGAAVAARLGNRSQGGLAADINAPLASTLAVRLQAEGATEDSETDRVTHRRVAVQPSLAWRPDRDSELVVRWRHTKSEGLDYSGLPRKGTIEPADYVVPRSRILTAEGLPDSTSELDAFNVQWSQRLNATWSWRLVAAYVRAEYDQRGTFPLDSTTFTWPALSPLDGPVYGLYGARLWNEQTSTVVAPSVTGRLQAGGALHTLTAGVDFDRTQDDAFLVFSPGFGFLGPVNITQPAFPAWSEPIAPATPDQQNRYRSTGAYVQNHADFGGWQLLASLRQTSVKVTDVNPAFGVSNDTKNDKTLGRVGAVVQLVPAVSAFAGWGQGMRVPTFAVFTSPPKPELSEQTELGLRLSNWNGLSGTIAWFDLSLKNGLQPDPVNVGQTLQVGREESRGVDIDMQWQFSASTRLLAAVSRLNTEVVDTGKAFVDVPKTAARLALRHDLGAGSVLPELGLGLGLKYHSALKGDAGNTYETPAATVFDAQASYRVGSVRLGLVLDNLTDRKYWVPSRYFGGGQVTPAPRRSVAATASWQL
jgi:iron complex outermembrane receptor protein